MRNATHRRSKRPLIGMLWGDFPWSEPPRKLGKMLSVGVTARILTRALGIAGEVIPYVPPPSASPAAQRDALADFLRRIDVLWADLYPPSDPAVRLRHELDLPCAAILWAGGAMPKAAEAILYPWQHLLRPGDGLLFTSTADREIWRRLVDPSTLYEWVLPLAVDEAVFRPQNGKERAGVRERHGLPAKAPLLLYVGRLNIQKNLHTLLRLLAHVRQRVPDTHLCLVGEEDDIGLWEFGARNTGYLRWLNQLAGELEVREAITFVHPLFGDDLARLYGAADVLVNLGFYHRENFGLAQAEAQACGVPVVWHGLGCLQRRRSSRPDRLLGRCRSDQAGNPRRLDGGQRPRRPVAGGFHGTRTHERLRRRRRPRALRSADARSRPVGRRRRGRERLRESRQRLDGLRSECVRIPARLA